MFILGAEPCIQSWRRASIGFMLCVWLMGAGDQRAWRAGFTAVSHRCDPAYLPSQGPRNQLTHARKGEAVRHRGGHACGDREPMPVCMPVALWHASISGGLVMLAVFSSGLFSGACLSGGPQRRGVLTCLRSVFVLAQTMHSVPATSQHRLHV